MQILKGIGTLNTRNLANLVIDSPEPQRTLNYNQHSCYNLQAPDYHFIWEVWNKIVKMTLDWVLPS